MVLFQTGCRVTGFGHQEIPARRRGHSRGRHDRSGQFLNNVQHQAECQVLKSIARSVRGQLRLP